MMPVLANLIAIGLFLPLLGDALAPAERLIWGLLPVGGAATLEGMLVTVLVVYAPGAVSTFDERHYLSARS